MKNQCFNGLTLSKECTFCKYHPSNAAQTGGTQPTDVQQLKAEIAAFANELSDIHIKDCDIANVKDLVERMRQLSAV